MNRPLFITLATMFFCMIAPLFVGEKVAVVAQNVDNKTLIERAEQTYKAVRRHMATADKNLLQEAIPRQNDQKEFSYLWGYSAMLSATCAIYETTGSKKWLKEVDKRMLRGLENYRDEMRNPPAYASYVNTSEPSDRFYDDNIWLAIDLIDLYAKTKKPEYLNKTKEIWAFIQSGSDDKLGGGVYWCEQKKGSKNTCSNAPASVLALKIYSATGEKQYLDAGKALYEWTKTRLSDPDDHLLYDNISLRGKVDKKKYSYNTGQMIQAAVLLHTLTGAQSYLKEAQQMAHSAYFHFFESRDDAGKTASSDSETASKGSENASLSDSKPRFLKGGEMWFDAVMLRGYIALHAVDGNETYLNAYRTTLNEAWKETSSRDKNGLFGSRYDHRGQNGKRTLLNQAAMIEMLARLGGVAK